MGEITVATLNTRGIAPFGSGLAGRYRAIARWFEASTVDVVSFQEVLTHYHLWRLTRYLPSFTTVSYRRSVAGPAGGVVTLSRLPVAGREYHPFPRPGDAAGLSRLTRLAARWRGTLVTRLARPGLSVLATHPMANRDGDWSPANRYHALQRDQLAALAGTVRATPGPLVLCGDFNVPREDPRFQDLLARTGLVDAFGGTCPPTFHAEFLGPGRTPRCIDFILVDASIRVTRTQLIATGKQPLPGGPGYLSDHIGLSATLVVAGDG